MERRRSGGTAELPRDEVERIARLAQLELSEEEVSRLAREMADVLRHFRQIRRLGADPDAGPSPSAGPLRSDEVAPDPLRRPVPELAPEWRDGHFLVPRLPALGGGEGDGEGP